jgi:hypothetical protein
MKQSFSPRMLLSWFIVAVLAFGWSIRPAALESLDLYAEPPSEPPVSAASDSVTASASAYGASYKATSVSATQPATATSISWRVLASLDYVSGKMSDTLRTLNGKRVRVPGFIVPLDDFQDVVKEFLLVPYFGACVHTPPPPPNQLVFVKMTGKQKVSLFEPVWIEGTLMVKQYQSVYGAVGFQLAADRITPYR